MLSKRLIAVVTVKEGLVVQSFGFNKYLPIGSPDVVVENLDRWGADEIVLNVIDRTRRDAGPDLELIDSIADLGISTPVIYGGGIRDQRDAVEVIQRGADRVSLSSIVFRNPLAVEQITNSLGSQAVVAALPLEMTNGFLKHFDYLTGKSHPFSEKLSRLLKEQVISEVMVIDRKNEGSFDGFDCNLVRAEPLQNTKLIAFGGIADPALGSYLLGVDNVSALAIGNAFTYEEHAIQCYSRALSCDVLRPPYFRDESSHDWNK
jgi:cyclase